MQDRYDTVRIWCNKIKAFHVCTRYSLNTYFSHICLKLGMLAYFDGFDFIRLASKTSIIEDLIVIENLLRSFVQGHEIPYV